MSLRDIIRRQQEEEDEKKSLLEIVREKTAPTQDDRFSIEKQTTEQSSKSRQEAEDRKVSLGNILREVPEATRTVGKAIGSGAKAVGGYIKEGVETTRELSKERNELAGREMVARLTDDLDELDRVIKKRGEFRSDIKEGTKKLGAELTGDISKLGAMGLDKVTGSEGAQTNPIYAKIDEYSQPENERQAKAKKAVDFLSNVPMGGVAGTAKATAKAGVKAVEKQIDDVTKTRISAFIESQKDETLNDVDKADIAIEARDVAEEVGINPNLTDDKLVEEFKGITSQRIDTAGDAMREKPIQKASEFSVNPTGGLMVDYTPEIRATQELDSDKLTTLDKSIGGNVDDEITIYRGAPKNQKSIVPGDFITDLPELADSYMSEGGGVLELTVRKGDILDEIDGGGNEYIYRPNADRELANKETSKNLPIETQSIGVIPNEIQQIAARLDKSSLTPDGVGSDLLQRLESVDKHKLIEIADDAGIELNKTMPKKALLEEMSDEGYDFRKILQYEETYFAQKATGANKYDKMADLIEPHQAEIIHKFLNRKNIADKDLKLDAEIDARDLAETLGINQDVTAAQLSNKLKKVISSQTGVKSGFANTATLQALTGSSVGASAGIEQGEDGSIGYDMTKGALGALAGGALTIGVSKAIKNRGAKSALDDLMSREVDPTVPKTMSREELQKILNKGGPALTRFTAGVQDNFITLRNLVESGEVKVSDISDPYLVRTQFDGIVTTKLKDLREEVIDLDKKLIKDAKDLGVDDAKLQKDIDSFLVARHAPERNTVHGDGAAGIETAKAQEVVASLGKNPIILDHAAKLQDISDRTLEVLLKGEVISKEKYDTLKATYKNHVPLQRVLDEDDTDMFFGGGGSKGYGTKSDGLKKAKGSKKEVADVTSNIVFNLEQAVIRAEKNAVGLSLHRMVKENDNLGELFEVLEKRPEVDKNILAVKVKGETEYIKIKDKIMADAFNGLNFEQVAKPVQYIGAATRFMSALMTRFNAEFMPSNFVRDVQSQMMYIDSTKGFKRGDATRAAMSTPKSTKAIMDYNRGKDTPDAKLYRQMMEDGGTTGGLGLSTKTDVDLSISKMRKLNRSNTRKAGTYLLDKIDKINQVVEDTNRFSAYKKALDRGMSRPRAAQIAKESTVNFNRKGTYGTFMNSIYMFSNASVQGTAKNIRSMKNPKTAAKITAFTGTATIGVNQWNDSVDPEWKDAVGDFERRRNLVILLPDKNSKKGYNRIKIPVAYELMPIKALFDSMHDVESGAKNAGEGTKHVLESVLHSTNPIGGELGSPLDFAPSIFQPALQSHYNETFYGGMIAKPDKAGIADHTEHFSSLENTKLGKGLVKGTKKMFEITSKQGDPVPTIDLNPAKAKYVLEGYTGGLGKSIQRLFTTTEKAISPEKADKKDLFIANRFIAESDPEKVESSKFYKKKDKMMRALSQIDPDSDEYRDAASKLLLKNSKDDQEYDRLYKSMYFDADQSGISTRRSIEGYKEVYTALQEKSDKDLKLIVDQMNDSEKKAYKSTATVIKSANTRKLNKTLKEEPEMAVRFMRSLPSREGKRLLEKMSDEDYAIYGAAKKRINSLGGE